MLVVQVKDNKFVVKNGILYYRHKNLRIYVPKNLRHKVMKGYHDSINHHGRNKLSDLIKKRCYWYGYYGDIVDFINSCIVCQRSKIGKRHSLKIKPIISKSFNEFISVDIQGPLLISTNKKKYNLTIQDHYSKYVIIIPISNCKTITIMFAIVNKWIYVYGICENIINDNGSQFISHLYKLLMKIFNIKIIIHHLIIQKVMVVMKDYIVILIINLLIYYYKILIY